MMRLTQRLRLHDITELTPVPPKPGESGPRRRWLVNLEADIDQASVDRNWDGEDATHNAVLRFVTFDGQMVEELKSRTTFDVTLEDR